MMLRPIGHDANLRGSRPVWPAPTSGAFPVASPARREELARIVVQNVVVRDRQVEGIEWTPPARPFFEKRQRECPQGDSNP